MIQPVNLLLLLWVAITGVMLGVWMIKRRRRNAAYARLRKAAPAATIDETTKLVPHPALVRIPAGVQATAGSTTPETTPADTARDEARQATADSTPPGTTPADTARDEAVVTSLIPALSADGLRTVTDILEGIRLPYDLTPVPSVVEDPDRHLVFLTTHSNAGEVGKRFADELERLGFEIESVEFDQAVAVRGGDVVSMKIVGDADQVVVAGSPRYGAAGSGDVALETWIGSSPVPPTSTE